MSLCDFDVVSSANAFVVAMSVAGSAAGWNSMSNTEQGAAHDEAVDKALAQAGKA